MIEQSRFAARALSFFLMAAFLCTGAAGCLQAEMDSNVDGDASDVGNDVGDVDADNDPFDSLREGSLSFYYSGAMDGFYDVSGPPQIDVTGGAEFGEYALSALERNGTTFLAGVEALDDPFVNLAHFSIANSTLSSTFSFQGFDCDTDDGAENCVIGYFVKNVSIEAVSPERWVEEAESVFVFIEGTLEIMDLGGSYLIGIFSGRAALVDSADMSISDSQILEITYGQFDVHLLRHD